MSSIKRSAKKSKTNFELLQEVKEELDLETVPCNCQPQQPKMPTNVNMDFCLNQCRYICERFFSWEFIYMACNDLTCTEEMPCERCLLKIEKYKVLIRVYRVLFPQTEKKARLIDYVQHTRG